MPLSPRRYGVRLLRERLVGLRRVQAHGSCSLKQTVMFSLARLARRRSGGLQVETGPPLLQRACVLYIGDTVLLTGHRPRFNTA